MQRCPKSSGDGPSNIVTSNLLQHDVCRGILVVLELVDCRGSKFCPIGLQTSEPDFDIFKSNALNSVRHVHLENDMVREHVLDDTDRVLCLAFCEGLWFASMPQRFQCIFATDVFKYANQLCGCVGL